VSTSEGATMGMVNNNNNSQYVSFPINGLFMDDYDSMSIASSPSTLDINNQENHDSRVLTDSSMPFNPLHSSLFDDINFLNSEAVVDSLDYSPTNFGSASGPDGRDMCAEFSYNL